MNQLIKQSMEKCEDLLVESYVSNEIKLVLKDLLAVVKNMENVVSSNAGMSADKRYKEATYNQERNEKRKLEKSLDQWKQVITQDLPPVIKDMAVEVQQIMHQGQELKNPQLIETAQKMKASLRQLVEVMASAGKPQA